MAGYSAANYSLPDALRPFHHLQGSSPEGCGILSLSLDESDLTNHMELKTIQDQTDSSNTSSTSPDIILAKVPKVQCWSHNNSPHSLMTQLLCKSSTDTDVVIVPKPGSTVNNMEIASNHISGVSSYSNSISKSESKTLWRIGEGELS